LRYTSRCSFPDNEVVGKHAHYAGKRIKRGLFKTKKGVILNADVNAVYNIPGQGVPDAFADGIKGAGLHPVLVGLA
jgi:putative transposase